MRMPNHTSQKALTDFKRLIARGAEEIVRRWQEAVSAKRSGPALERLEEPLILSSVPLVLDDILLAIESYRGRIRPEKICRAARLGRTRARQHVDVRDLLQEFQLLREQVFLYFQEHAAQSAELDSADLISICSRVGLAIDEAVRETISAYVEEHTGHLRQLSRTDSLTGLNNHRTFYERLDHELRRAIRYGAPLSIVLIDLDDFKSVNDEKGHQFGDFLLTACADLLRHELRETDVICRYGGDEFGVILPETTREAARAMMCRLSNAFRTLGTTEGAPASFGMSFGVSEHPADDGSLTRLVKVADERLFTNKRRNDGTIVLFPEILDRRNRA
jgi:diguanylate cyclase (GGDEF)-like protein